jgi:predicted phage terminase large subunit-like protein
LKSSLAESIACLPEKERKELLGSLSEEEAKELLTDWRFWARKEQLPPEGNWSTWLILAGRGFGKTRTGAEWVRARVEGKTPLGVGSEKARRIALVAETAADARDVMVEGESGILALSAKDKRPKFTPSKRRLTWPNGAVATLYNAVEPDQLRGPQHDTAWLDELAKWRYAEDTWAQLQFGLRLGEQPQACITTTPRPIKVILELLRDPDCVVTRGRSHDNIANLAPNFIDQIVKRYEGTRLGRQELEGDILEDVPGALWQRKGLDDNRRSRVPDLARVVVAIDPAASASQDSDETGIIVAGLGTDGDGYVLADLSLKASPAGWARRARDAYHEWQADRIVAEVNNGGDMVAHVIRSLDDRLAFKAVRASRGKVARAEPVAALDEQGRIHHVGCFPNLEDQMCAFTSHFDRSRGATSPDRVDARVWAFHELMLCAPQGMPRIRTL